jgi:hypothetical protein
MEKLINAIGHGTLKVYHSEFAEREVEDTSTSNIINIDGSKEQDSIPDIDAVFRLIYVEHQNKKDTYIIGVVADNTNHTLQVIDMGTVKPVFSVVRTEDKKSYKITYPEPSKVNAKLSEVILVAHRLNKLMKKCPTPMHDRVIVDKTPPVL